MTKLLINKNNTKTYPLRTKTGASKDPAYITPTKASVPKDTKTECTPSTPSSNTCKICMGVESMRNLNFEEAIQEFTSKIGEYKLLTKSLQENPSTLNHSIDTIKHFMLSFEPDKAENAFEKINAYFGLLRNNINELSNIVTKINTSVTERSISKITNDIELLIGSMTDLSNYVTKIGSIETLLDRYISQQTRDSPSTNNNNTIHDRLNQLESLCNQLNNKIDSITNVPAPTQVEHPTQSTDQNINRNPKACIILGDSNTKYVHVNMEKVHHTIRASTFTIDDIDPAMCIGYSKIWLHVGINNLKSYNCSNDRDVHRHFQHFTNKLKAIQRLCPSSRIIISPILPTNIPKLNHRALIFNKLLFSIREDVTFLDFNSFCGRDSRLLKIYRCYNNEYDNIHLGALGIRILESKLINALKYIDSRSYATVLRNNFF